MQEAKVVESLGALAQPQRLRAFRALVVAGPDGLTPSVLAGMLRIAPNALSFHLKTLTHAKLVTAESSGRNLIYRANFKTMNSVLGYLTEHCCEGAACEVKASPASTCRTC
jgi:DNA-binding transcriptional ArsR family regulator